MKRRLFNIAWSIVGSFDSFGDALRHAWRIVKLQAKMAKGAVGFAYKKVDGSIRQAVGTFVNAPEVKGTGPAHNAGQIIYFDVEANAWRSFKGENLI